MDNATAKPVMDVAPPPKPPVPVAPTPQAPAALAPPAAPQPPVPPHVPVRLAPVDDSESVSAGPAPTVSTTVASAPTPKPARKPSTAPVGIIAATVIVMLVLSALAVVVYLKSQK